MFDELVKKMLSSPWFNFRTFKRLGASQLNGDGTVLVTDISQQASARAAGGLGAYAAMVHHLGPVGV
jgi:hypothetical protein